MILLNPSSGFQPGIQVLASRAGEEGGRGDFGQGGERGEPVQGGGKVECLLQQGGGEEFDPQGIGRRRWTWSAGGREEREGRGTRGQWAAHRPGSSSPRRGGKEPLDRPLDGQGAGGGGHDDELHTVSGIELEGKGAELMELFLHSGLHSGDPPFRYSEVCISTSS